MLLKTDLLYTALGKPIKNGMLRLAKDGTVLEVGTQLHAEEANVKYLPGALCPGFVNTHCHLELSHLKGKINSGEGLIAFIKGVQNERKAEEEEIQNALAQADQAMWKAGIVAVGDISNGTSTFKQKQSSPITYHTFVELFGFDPTQAESVWKRGKEIKFTAENMGLTASLVPHSPYSVSKALFSLLKAEQNNSPMCIHNQETAAENEFYQSGTGGFKNMLESFGLSIDHFQGQKQNSLPAYLPYLPNEKPLLLVHNTYTSKADIEEAEKLHPNLYWCFCPRANDYIESRLPQMELFLEQGIKCTLGTDSLASNYSLSIWEEMKLIKKHYPQISLEALMEWGCKNGAEFLGMKDLGGFEVGKKPGVNWLKGLNGDGSLEGVEVQKVIF
ncbi:MAG: amidohydrolase family protein [Vicingaceae bacterium]